MATSVGAGGGARAKDAPDARFRVGADIEPREDRAAPARTAGAAYYEAALERLGSTGFARVGVASREANLDASVGADAHGYAFIQKDGERGARSNARAVRRRAREGGRRRRRVSRSESGDFRRAKLVREDFTPTEIGVTRRTSNFISTVFPLDVRS